MLATEWQKLYHFYNNLNLEPFVSALSVDYISADPSCNLQLHMHHVFE